MGFLVVAQATTLLRVSITRPDSLLGRGAGLAFPSPSDNLDCGTGHLFLIIMFQTGAKYRGKKL